MLKRASLNNSRMLAELFNKPRLVDSSGNFTVTDKSGRSHHFPMEKSEATKTGNIATYLTPIAPPLNRSPLRFQGYEHGMTQKDLCKRCKKLGYICPECSPAKKRVNK